MADAKVSDLGAISSVVAGDLFMVASGGVSYKATGTQVAAFLEGRTNNYTIAQQFTTLEIGHASDTTLSRSSAGVLAVEGVTLSLNSTSAAHTAGTIELGHATDTTISRSSAGVIAVEGVTVPLNSTSSVHTASSIELGHATDTTLARSAAGTVTIEGNEIVTSGTTQTINGAKTFGADAVFSGDIRVNGNQIFFGGTSTYINYSATDQFDIVTNNNTRFRVKSTGDMELNYPTYAYAQLNCYQTSFGTNLNLQTNDAGANGPVAQSLHSSASPTAGDIIFNFSHYGLDSAANSTNYASEYYIIVDATNGSEDARVEFNTMIAGTLGPRLNIGGGLYHSSATGGDKGNNTINFGAVYDDNILLTCYVRDVYEPDLDAVKLFEKWDARVPNIDVPAKTEKIVEYVLDENGEKVLDENKRPITTSVTVVEIEPASEIERTHEPLRKFVAKLGTPHDPRYLESYNLHWREKRHLTSMPNEENFDIKKGLPTGAWVQRLVETAELQHEHDMQLLARIEALEARLAAAGIP